MIEIPQIVLERIGVAWGERTVANSSFPRAMTEATGFCRRRLASPGTGLFDLALRAAHAALGGRDARGIGAVVAATYSNPERFPPLAVRLAGELGLGSAVPALDLQMACCAYPYALYVAGRLATDLGASVLVIDGDVQSPFVNGEDAATAPLFSDAATATVVSSSGDGAVSRVAFLTRSSDALVCPAAGPIRMDGFGVFSFVAKDVVEFLKPFGSDHDLFVPHQANAYMIRQLARSLGLEERLATATGDGNPGSCSIPVALARAGRPGRALLAGFGAGLAAAAATVRIANGFSASEERLNESEN